CKRSAPRLLFFKRDIRNPTQAGRMLTRTRLLLPGESRVSPDQHFEIGILARSTQDQCMKIATIIARILLGLIFIFFGSNAFLHFIPMPPPPQNLAGDYVKVFLASGYVYVIGGMQLLSGLLLLIGRFVPLALTILAAIIFNI